MRLLIVHPDINVQHQLAREFAQQRYQVTTTKHGSDALHSATTDTPDLIIVALDLPDVDGLNLIRQVRDHSTVPIIATIPTVNPNITVKALFTGADDVVSQPFATIEVVARSVALLRRSGRDPRTLKVNHAGISFDFALRLAMRNGNPVTFTALEWRCLETFATHPKRLFLHDELIARIYGVSDAVSHRDALRALIRRLRRTLHDNPSDPTFIETHAGVGYRWLA